MSTLRKATKNLGLLSSAQLLARVIGLFVSALLARHLGQAGFGHFQLCISVPGIFGVMARLGVGANFVRDLAADPARGPRYVSTAIVLVAVQGVLTVAVTAGAALVLGYRGDQFIGILVMAVALIAVAYETLFYSVFESADRMDREAAMILLRQVTWTALALGLIAMKAPYIPLLWALLLTGVVGALASGLLTSRTMFRFRLSVDRDAARHLLKAGLPLAIAALLVDIYLRVGILILDRMKGPEAVGLYTAGYRLIESLMFLSGSFYIVVFPILSRLHAHGGEERLRYAYTQSIKFISLILFPISAGVAALAVPILRLVYGEEFVPGGSALAIVGCVVGLQGLSVVMGRLLIVVHRLGAIIRISLVTVVVNVGLNLLLIPRFGIVGVAIAGVVSEGVVVLLNWVALGGAVKRPNLIADLWRIALASLGMGLVVWWVREMPLVATVPIGIVTYAVFLFSLGGLTKEDRGVLLRIVKRS